MKLEDLYATRFKQWVRAAQRICQHDAEAAVQDAVATAATWSLPEDAGEAHAVILSLVKKRALMIQRKQRGEQRAVVPAGALVDLDEVRDLADDSPSPLDLAIASQERERWAEKLGLDPDDLDGMSQEEVAAYLGVSTRTLRYWSSQRARSGEVPRDPRYK